MHIKLAESIPCSKCEQKFDFKIDLYKHWEKEHKWKPKDWKCKICRRIFDTEDCLKKYVLYINQFKLNYKPKLSPLF